MAAKAKTPAPKAKKAKSAPKKTVKTKGKATPSNADTTPKATDGRLKNLKPPFKKGQSGNPKGRPPGSRNRISEAFLQALCDDLDKHGVATLRTVRRRDPSVYMNLVAKLMPRDYNVNHTGDAFSQIWTMVANQSIQPEMPMTAAGRTRPVANLN